MLFRKRAQVRDLLEPRAALKFKARCIAISKAMVPRPIVDDIWMNHIHLLLLLTLQYSILPRFFGQSLAIDVITPWIILQQILQKKGLGFYLTILTALALETHSTAPFGMYLTIYGMFYLLVQHLRDTLGWKYLFSWIMTFLIAGLGVILFEFQVLLITTGWYFPDGMYWVYSLMRLTSIVLIGLQLAKPWITREHGSGLLVFVNWLREFLTKQPQHE